MSLRFVFAVLISILFFSCSKDTNSIFGQVTYYDKADKAIKPAGLTYIQVLSTGKNAHFYDLTADSYGYYELKEIYSGHYTVKAFFSPDGTANYTGTKEVDLSFHEDKVVDIKVEP